jgi:hypothetical protein
VFVRTADLTSFACQYNFRRGKFPIEKQKNPMEPPTEKSVVVNALATVLRTVAGPGQVIVCNNDPTSATFRVLSYKHDFEYLWGLSGTGDDGLPDFVTTAGNGITLVVVWDGLPPSAPGSSAGVDTARYLTPLDWAVGLALEIDSTIKSKKIEQRPALRLFILDLSSSQQRDSDSVQFFEQFPKRTIRSLPWVRLLRPAGQLDRDWTTSNLLSNVMASPSAAPVAGANMADANIVPFMNQCYPNGNGPDLSLIRRNWSANFTQPSKENDRHAIANLVGPLMLLGKRGGDPRVRALWKLLQQLDLLSDSDKPENEPWINWTDKNWSSFTDPLKGLTRRPWNFLVLDDGVYQNHWGEFVCQVLGAKRQEPADPKSKQLSQIGERNQSPEIDVYAQASPEDWLNSAGVLGIADSASFREKRFCLSGLLDPVSSKPEPLDVLFLDLRLFQVGGMIAEAEFIAELLRIAKFAEIKQIDIQDDQGSPTAVDLELPWPGFTGEVLTKLHNWVEEARRRPKDIRETHRDYDLVLTLLPRLIALLDPSLPIVLFSSTGRRAIAELLKPYGNIITTFEKPRLPASDPKQVLEDARIRFQSAMAAALPMAAARRLCAELVSQNNGLSAPKVERPASRYVEIYFDESGGDQGDVKKGIPPNHWMKVGGLAVEYPDFDSAQRFSKLLRIQGLCWGPDENGPYQKDVPYQNGIRINGIRIDDVNGTMEWGEDESERPCNPSRSSFLKKRPPNESADVKANLGRLQTLAQENGIRIHAFLLGGYWGTAADQLLGKQFPDHAYRAMLEHALELLLFDFPGISLGNVTVAVYAATRVSKNLSKSEADALEHTWGVKCFPVYYSSESPFYAHLFTIDDAHPLVSSVLARRPKAPYAQNVIIKSARAVTLQYFDSEHFRTNGPNQGNKTPRQVHFVADWIVSYPEEVPDVWWSEGFREVRCELVLQAFRAADDASRRVEAIFAWNRLRRLPLSSYSAERWLRQRLSERASELSGEELIQLAKALAMEGPILRQGAIPFKETVDGTIIWKSRYHNAVFLDLADLGFGYVNKEEFNLAPAIGSSVQIVANRFDDRIACSEWSLVSNCHISWNEKIYRYPLAKRVVGLVKKLNTHAVIVALDDGIEGHVPWPAGKPKPNEGKKLRAVVIGHQQAQGRIKLELQADDISE